MYKRKQFFNLRKVSEWEPKKAVKDEEKSEEKNDVCEQKFVTENNL